jgi:hypothetical protein
MRSRLQAAEARINASRPRRERAAGAARLTGVTIPRKFDMAES